MTTAAASKFDFDLGVYRPPSEGGKSSLLVRFTRNCPWNRCDFCAMYKTEKFELRSVQEIKADIDAVAALCKELKGNGNTVSRDAAVNLINRYPELNYHQGFVMVYHWLLSGGKTAFIQDANSLIMPTDQLVEALRHLRQTFPSIERVTSYARTKTLAQKKNEELVAIREAGLDRLHVGLETGDETLLKKVKKGVTSEGHIKGGKKAMAAGFEFSAYWMPGLGGTELWKAHADNTARVLNEINPHYIRSRPFYILPNTPMEDRAAAGQLDLLTAHGVLNEIKRMVTALDVTSRVCFDHAGNYWTDRKGNLVFTHSYEGYKFPEQKQAVLDRIEEGLLADNQRPSLMNL